MVDPEEAAWEVKGQAGSTELHPPRYFPQSGGEQAIGKTDVFSELRGSIGMVPNLSYSLAPAQDE